MNKFIFGIFFLLVSNSNIGLCNNNDWTKLFLKTQFGQQAFYIITEQGQGLELEIKLPIEDLKIELNAMESCTDLTQIESCTKIYFEERFMVSIDGNWLEWSFIQSSIDQDFVTLNYVVEIIPLKIQRMTILNKCFVDQENYENIVQLNVRENRVSYKLGPEKTSIEHSFILAPQY